MVKPKAPSQADSQADDLDAGTDRELEVDTTLSPFDSDFLSRVMR